MEDFSETEEHLKVEELITKHLGNLFIFLGSCPQNYFRLSEEGILRKLEESKNPQKLLLSLNSLFNNSVSAIRNTGADIKFFIAEKLLNKKDPENNIFKRFESLE